MRRAGSCGPSGEAETIGLAYDRRSTAVNAMGEPAELPSALARAVTVLPELRELRDSFVVPVHDARASARRLARDFRSRAILRAL